MTTTIQDREVIKELVTTLDAVVDYALTMQMATKYEPEGSPNLLNACRLINRVNKEYKIKIIEFGGIKK